MNWRPEMFLLLLPLVRDVKGFDRGGNEIAATRCGRDF